MEIQPLPFINTCPICEKVYTQEYSYNRHVKYCQRAQSKRKGRPTSCSACSNAKAKCSFAQPCSRCTMKGLECIYNWKGQRKVVAIAGRPEEQAQQPIAMTQPSHQLNVLMDFQDMGSINSGLDLANTPTAHFGIQLSGLQQMDLSSTLGSPIAEDTFTDLTRLQYMTPVLKQAAKVISHMLLAFPQMMIRRNTFPPFIHPHWHRKTLPERLANCMSIAQLFAARTPETRPFVWRTINAEVQRLRDEAMVIGVRELQTSVQSMLIYIIMLLVDYDSETVRRGQEMITTIKIISNRFLYLLEGDGYSNTESTRPSVTWDDWIFAETRRRVTCMWFIVSRVICFERELPIDDCGGLCQLPICTGKTLWEARTLDEWQFERALHEASSPIETLGDLMNAQKSSSEPANAQRLQNWEAGADKMGFMMNIATVFV